jgi:endoglucanase
MGDGLSRASNWAGMGPLIAVLAALVAVAIGLPVAALAPTATSANAPAHTRLEATTKVIDPDLHVVGNALEDSTGAHLQLVGVDVTGTENACIQDKGFSWGPLDAAEAESIAAWHANAVRVPLNEDCWLGINGAPRAYSGAAYRAAIEQWVADLNGAGLVAIVDLHDSAPGAIPSNREWQMADESHAVTFWTQVATTFKSDPLVMFDLFNEPHLGGSKPSPSDWSCWLNGCTTTWHSCPTTTGSTIDCTTYTYQVAGMQQLVTTVRNTGADQPIMLGGFHWSGTLCKSYGPGSLPGCAWLNYEPVDPLHQLVVSFHNYDVPIGCHTLACWNATLAPLASKVPVVTGELGDDNCTATFVSQYMQWADLHGVSYLVWAWESNANAANCGPGRLLNTWNGAPSTKNPIGQLVSRHFGLVKAQRM